MISILKNSNSSDSELTTRAIAGQRDAFAQIVTRYQSLVCSLAYSATGSLSQSEDLAQETFIAAWKGLRTLREPEKLRSWLCSIARNIISSAVRNRKQEPAYSTESLDEAMDLPSAESLPVDRAISSEEESILWRSLEHIPQVYRESIILFYREGHSIESVAQALELSEEAVKQRLSRGRKLLKMEVETFVENALRRSAPGKEFTSAVLAGLPMLTLATSAFSIGTASSKGLVTAKTGAVSSFLGILLIPILSLLGTIAYITGFVKTARSKREKTLVIKWTATVVFLVVLFMSINLLAVAGLFSERIAVSAFVFLGVCIVIATKVFASRRKKIQIEEGHDRERSDPKLFFGNPESKGYIWNVYAWLIIVTICNSFAPLTANAAIAHDSITFFIIVAIMAATFLISRRVLINKPENAPKVFYAIMISQFPLFLAVIGLRWKMWTGQSPWQLKGYDLILPVVGFFLFALAITHWLLRRNR